MNEVDTSPARLRELADHINGAWVSRVFYETLLALADEKEEPVAAFDTVAIEFAHRLAMHLECLLLDCQPVSSFFDEAAETLGAYRSAMNAIHEQFSPTHMGEPVLEKEAARCSSLCHPEEPCSISADGKCPVCPTCGSDRNERDELAKAEREIEKLRAEKGAAERREPYAWARRQPDGTLTEEFLSTQQIEPAPVDVQPMKYVPLNQDHIHPSPADHAHNAKAFAPQPYPADVPLPEPHSYDNSGETLDDMASYTAAQMRDYAEAVLAAERSRIVESINAEIDLESLRDGESYFKGMARAAEITTQEGTK